MNKHLNVLYRTTLAKYSKFKKRYEKNIRSGQFYNLSERKQSQIINRLKKLFARLKQLKWQLKIAAATGLLVASLSINESKAQSLGPFVQNDAKNPFHRPEWTDTHQKFTFGDLDNDGDLDFVLGGYYGNNYFYLNTGTATNPKFVRDATHPVESISLPAGYSAPNLIDFDGDGDLDLIVADNSGYGTYSVFYYENDDFNDDGVLGNSPTFTLISGASSPIDGVDATKYHAKVDIVDIDGDGDMDIFVGQDGGNPSYQSIRFFENDSGFSLQPLPSGLGEFDFDTGSTDTAPTFFDVDGDGDMDLFIGQNNGQFRFFRNTDLDPSKPSDVTIGDDIAFTEETGASNPFNGFDGGNDVVITFVDLDTDGVEEAVVGSGNNDPFYFENDGSGNFTPLFGTSNPFETIDFGYDSSPTTFDIDNDGDLDFIIGGKYYAPESLFSFINNGDGTITELTGTSNPFLNILGSNIEKPVPEFADIDRDGDLDLIVGLVYYNGPAYGQIRFFENDGSNNFTPAASPTTISQNYRDYAQTLADFDGDGDLDMVIGTDYTYSFHFFENIGTPYVANFNLVSPSLPPFNGTPFDPGYQVQPKPSFVDLDHDGDFDVVSGGYYSSTASLGGTIYLFENIGGGELNRLYGANNPFLGIDLGSLSDPVTMDYDNDGDLDIFSGKRDGTIVFIENQNIPPQVNNNTSSGTFTEGDSPLVLDAFLALSDDSNDDAISASIAIQNYVSGEDFLDFTPQFGISGNFDTSTGILTLSGTATLAQYESALQSVTYENTSISPDVTTRNIQLSVTDFDNTDPFSDSFAEPVITVNVISLNDAPVITNSAGVTSFSENGGPVVIDPNLTVSDNDDINLEGATVTITSNFDLNIDFLAFTPQSGITGSFDSSSGTLTLSGTATVAQYQAALRSVTYDNISNNPTVVTRSIQFIVDDGTDVSVASGKNINITPVNDPPALFSENDQISLNYTRNTAAIIVDDLIDLSDSDNTDLQDASVTIVSFQSGDVLSFNNQNGITGSFSNGTLTLSGFSSLANYRTALRSITFQSSNLVGTRDISFVVNDGIDNSIPYVRTINIIGSQAPVVNTTPASTQVGSVITLDLCNIISDPDNTFEELTIEVISILSGAATSIDVCDLNIDYAGLSFTGDDIIVLRATDPDGNVAENSLTISVVGLEPGGELVIYNAVSPNGDGANDWWEIVNLTTPNEIKLYNRWGDEVKTITNYNNTPNNSELNDIPAGTYFYKIISPQGEYEGFIVIKK